MKKLKHAKLITNMPSLPSSAQEDLSSEYVQIPYYALRMAWAKVRLKFTTDTSTFG